ncbi:hypothetical protein M427DRAFT_492583 [Gonapodya prolifera JEL478]|uniref:Uncharacterized protein n=1 Tax=Gonapodya prolifera (strain JEL478) TaxID=1344416 RepID=A0A138ZX37_GONPJ|nr:hypothetical protein M427DRAFT_492583 [Gonapodya prolifera JEL478]|eukprot:KXS09058.1 hypothetical protein M427DRAFT_492583 [Gonapodya prolifera JEL478]
MASYHKVSTFDINKVSVGTFKENKAKTGWLAFINYNGEKMQFLLPLVRQLFNASAMYDKASVVIGFDGIEDTDEAGKPTLRALDHQRAVEFLQKLNAKIIKALEGAKKNGPMPKVALDTYAGILKDYTMKDGPTITGMQLRLLLLDAERFKGEFVNGAFEPFTIKSCTSLADVKEIEVTRETLPTKLPKSPRGDYAVESTFIYVDKQGKVSLNWRLIDVLQIDPRPDRRQLPVEATLASIGRGRCDDDERVVVGEFNGMFMEGVTI